MRDRESARVKGIGRETRALKRIPVPHARARARSRASNPRGATPCQRLACKVLETRIALLSDERRASQCAAVSREHAGTRATLVEAAKGETEREDERAGSKQTSRCLLQE